MRLRQRSQGDRITEHCVCEIKTWMEKCPLALATWKPLVNLAGAVSEGRGHDFSSFMGWGLVLFNLEDKGRGDSRRPEDLRTFVLHL